MEQLARVKRIVQAILFAADEPLQLADLYGLLSEVPGALVKQAANELVSETNTGDAAFVVAKVAGGFQYVTHADMSQYVKRLFEKQRTVRLTPAALETLACVAYRQPVTKAEVDEIRGVDCGGTLRSLIEKGLVRTAGRRTTPGRPLTHVTTDLFLSWFALASLDELPALDEMDELQAAVSLALPFQENEGTPVAPVQAETTSEDEQSQDQDIDAPE